MMLFLDLPLGVPLWPASHREGLTQIGPRTMHCGRCGVDQLCMFACGLLVAIDNVPP